MSYYINYCTVCGKRDVDNFCADVCFRCANRTQKLIKAFPFKIEKEFARDAAIVLLKKIWNKESIVKAIKKRGEGE